MKTTKSLVTILISILMFSPMVAVASQTITDDFNNTDKISTYSNLYVNTTAGQVYVPSQLLTLNPNSAGTYSQLTPLFASDSSLKLALPLDEGTGTKAYDVSGNGNDGTITSAGWVTGKFGDGLYFHGTTGNGHLIQIADDVGTGGYLTVAFWVKPVSISASGTLVDLWYSGHLSYKFRHSNTGVLQGYVYTSSQAGGSFSSSLTAGQWSWVVFVYDGSKIYLYVNGQVDGTSFSLTGNVATNIYGTRIGYAGTNEEPLNSTLDEVQIYTSAKTASWVSSTYNSYIASRYTLVNDKSDLTGIQTSSNNALKETFNLQDHTTENAEILKVGVFCRAKTLGTNDKFVFVVRTESTNKESSEITLTSSFTQYSVNYTTNPQTEVAWTWAEVDALEVGVRPSTLANGVTEQFSDLWITVVYGAKSGQLYSINLLSGLNVTDVYEFSYDATIIGDETISISFTQNNVTFYSSTALGASQLLQNGAHTINLRTLGWKGGFFYYNVTFTEGSSGTTPELNEISLSYSTSTTEGKILGTVLVVGIISLPIIVAIMLVRKRK